MEVVWVPIFGFLGVLVTAVIGWVVVKHKTSGTVATSEAAEIWTANRELRDMLVAEAATRTAENVALRREAEERRKEMEECHAKGREMVARIAVLEADNAQIRAELVEMVQEITSWKF